MSQKLVQHRVEMTSAESVPEDARVRHFDQLDERAQRVLFDVAHDGATGGRVPELTDGDSAERSSAGSRPALRDGDVVVFTDYYRVNAE